MVNFLKIDCMQIFRQLREFLARSHHWHPLDIGEVFHTLTNYKIDTTLCTLLKLLDCKGIKGSSNCMSLDRDEEGYIISIDTPNNHQSETSFDFSSITRTAISESSSESLQLSEPKASASTLDNIFPLPYRRFANRYILYPFLSGILSAFTQEIFRLRRQH